MAKNIEVKGQMVKNFGDDTMIYSWMRNRNTLEFIGIWEELHNPNFNSNEFVTFKSQAGLNSYKLNVKEWTKKTNAIRHQQCKQLVLSFRPKGEILCPKNTDTLSIC